MATPHIILSRGVKIGTNTQLKALGLELSGVGDLPEVSVGIPIAVVGPLITILLHGAAALALGHQGSLTEAMAGPRVLVRPRLAVGMHPSEPLVALTVDAGGVYVPLAISADQAHEAGEQLIRSADQIDGRGSALH
jgi:hypothetical protein